MADSSAIVKSVMEGFSQAQDQRAIFANHWEDVARLVLPYYSSSFLAGTQVSPGREVGQEMFDATANTALFRFAAAMESMLTPRNSKWHRITITDPNLAKLRRVQLWSDQVNDILFHYRYAPRSGYQSQQHDAYVGIGAFGTSSMFIDQMRDPNNRRARGLRYRNIPLPEYFLCENHQGDVDKAFRRFQWSIRAVAQRWGEDKLPSKLKSRLQKEPEAKVWLIHHVRPRAEWTPYALDGTKMPFASYYVLEDEQVLMEEGGYTSFPMPTARYLTAPGEWYGRSPAMNVLPAIRGANAQKKTFLKQMQRTADPVLLAHDDGVIDGIDLTPGSVNFGGVNAEGRRLVDTLPVGNPLVIKDSLQDERQTMNDAFLVSLFQILMETPTMTATEVLERAREKGALLSPTMGRYQTEALGPMILREYDVLWQQGLIPPPPPELIEANGKWDVEYDAPLNRAMRAEEGAGLQRTIQFGIEVANATQDPSALDWLDPDVYMPALADINGVPFRWIRDPQVVAQLRQSRQQAASEQQLIDAGPSMAAMVKATAPQGSQVTS